MTIITDISSFMLPTKLQYIYDYIHNHKSNNDSTISYDQFTKFISHLHLLSTPNHPKTTIHLTVPNTKPKPKPKPTSNKKHDSDFLHYIFSTYQQTTQSQHTTQNKGQYWLQILSKPNNGCSINSEKFIKAITDCNIQSMTHSLSNTISGHRSGFSSKLRVSPRTSLTRTKSCDKSDTNSVNINQSEYDYDTIIDTYEIPTDSDLESNEFDILKKLPTWKKLKLSVYERRQRYKRKQKNIQRLKDEQNLLQKQQQQKQKQKQLNDQKSEEKNENYKLDIVQSTTTNTYSDLDFSSDDDYDDIIKGPSPPPRKMMSIELKAMCGNLINELLSSPRSFYFRNYFPFQKWELVDFNDYFPKNHLHLNIVKNKLENDEYETPGLFASDVRTIFNNATLYHWEGARQYRIKQKAMLLLDEFEEKYLDILAEDEVSQKIRHELIQSMQEREQREEKRDVHQHKRTQSSTSNRYNSSGDNNDEFDSFSDTEIESDSSDEYSISSKTNLTHRKQSSVIANTSITMNSIPEQKRSSTTNGDDGDEISEMMKTLQQLTDVTDVKTMQETNDYINNIRLDLMIAQKISRESPRLQKMRFLKQLHQMQLLMENKRKDMISYTIYNTSNNIKNRLHNKSVSEKDKLYVQRTTSVRNTFFPDEKYSYNKYAWNRCKNSSIDSRGSQTFVRAHDLSIRYAINFPKSITIKANKRRKSGSSMSMSHSKCHEDTCTIDDNNIENTFRASSESLHEVENENDSENDIEFEQLPHEMTDEKLIEEHTDDLWAAMPLVPVEILEKSVRNDGLTFVESECVVCEDLDKAMHLLADQYFNYTYSYVKTQFMTHFGKLRVGRDIFVGKLHHIFDSHKEFKWLRLNLPNYYVTPKSIIPMECMNNIETNPTKTQLFALLQILSTGQNIQPVQIIYQHKLYLYELLKLSGVIRINDDDIAAPMDTYDEFILCLDELWAMSDGNNLEEPMPFMEHPLLAMTTTKSNSKPGSTPTVFDTFSFSDEFKHEMNINSTVIMDKDDIVCDEISDVKSYEITSAQHLIPFVNSDSDCNDEVTIIPTDGTQYAQHNAMNENYAGNHHSEHEQNAENNNNNNNDSGGQGQQQGQGTGGSGGGGDGDGDEKKNNDNNNDESNPWNDAEEKQQNEEKQNEDIIEQEIEIVDAPNDNNNNNTGISRMDRILRILGILLTIILAIVFGFDFLSMDSEYDSQQLSQLFQQADEFIQMYDGELFIREKNGLHKVLFTDEIASDNPSQTWINGLHIGSLVDALDVESKWYTAYVTNIDLKTGTVKIHYDDWQERFDEWHDPQSGRIAPYRTRAIGGRFQGGLPGRPALPIKPQNDSGLTDWNKMKINLLRQQKNIPDFTINVFNNNMKKYKQLFNDIFYEIGIVYNDRAVYMNHNKIYVFYDGHEWCVGSEYKSEEKETIICIASNALRPELIDISKQIDIKFRNVVFKPAYLLPKSSKKTFTPIGNKGLKNIPVVQLNNKVMMPQVIIGTAGIHSDSIFNAAAKLGYYMFDTGMQMINKPIYYNHKYLNKLFKIYGRSTIGISTKIPSFSHGYHSTIHNFISQLYTLGTDYIDLVVIEHPECMKHNIISECEGNWLDTWRALEYLYEKKMIRALGVSQFNIKQLELIIKYKQKHIPLSVVRDWRDPLHSNSYILQWCQQNNIQFQAFSTFGGKYLTQNNGIINPILNNPNIQKIANKNGMTSAQVVIKWNLQRNVGIVIKTSNLDHLTDNLDTFMFDKLTDNQLYDIDKLGGNDKPAAAQKRMKNNNRRHQNVQHDL